MTADGLTEALQRLKADLECVRDHLPTMTLRVSLDRAFEALAAHRAEQAQAPQDYVLALLVAAGHVTQGKVEEARAIASKQARAAAAKLADSAGDAALAKGIRAMFLRDMRKMASDLVDTDEQAAALLQHGDVNLTRKHYRTRAVKLTPVR